jgi:23S rRNA-/tRNA-specific pseudouridylate synthase
VDGVPLGVKAGLVYYLLNKPTGVVTTASDPQGRPTVVDLVPTEPRVYPVGRLDVGTEGLLLLTNDGDLANRIAHPSHGVEKEYLAEVEGTPSNGPTVIVPQPAASGQPASQQPATSPGPAAPANQPSLPPPPVAAPPRP